MTLVLAWLISSLIGFIASTIDTYDAWRDYFNQRGDPLYKHGDLIDRTALVRLQSRAVLLGLTGLWVACGLLAVFLHDGHTGEIILWGLVAGNVLVAGEGLWFKGARLRKEHLIRQTIRATPPPSERAPQREETTP